MSTVLALALALLVPPVPQERAPEPEPEPGLVCYWGCYAACVVTFHTQEWCDRACEDYCFREAVCDPEQGQHCA